MKVCVIFNPAARGEKARSFRHHLAGLAADCSLKPTSAPGAGRALAAEAVREGHQVIVAAGGDGTINEVLNGIAEEPDGLARVKLGVLPLGTVNVFAKELGIPMRFQRAWEIVRFGKESVIDLAQAEYTQVGRGVPPSRPQIRYFAQMAGAGWDSRAVALVDWEMKKKLGKMAYVLAGLKALRRPLPQIIASNGRETLVGEQVLIGNGRFYAGRFRFFPQADLRDGKLDVTVLPRIDLAGILKATLGVLTGQLYRWGGARHLRAQSIELTSATPAMFEVEGENIAPLPARFSVKPKSLRVLVPP